jgi:hypothetical protein
MRRLAVRAFSLAIATAALTGTSALTGPSAHAATTDPFSLAKSPERAALSSFVGRDSGGASVAVVLTSSKTAVAYVCDGTGKISTWFSGTIDNTGAARLTSSSGSTLDFNTKTKALKLKLGAASTSGSLALTTSPYAGLFRSDTTFQGKPSVTGWIVHPDGTAVGSTALGGKTTVSIAAGADGGGDVVAGEPGGASTGTTAPAPVPTGLIKNIRCGILQIRTDRSTTMTELNEAIKNYNAAGCNVGAT